MLDSTPGAADTQPPHKRWRLARATGMVIGVLQRTLRRLIRRDKQTPAATRREEKKRQKEIRRKLRGL